MLKEERFQGDGAWSASDPEWHFDRDRLERAIAEGTQQRVAFIIAPPGFGKSVALRDFVRRHDNAVSFEVPPAGASLYAFVRGLARSLASHSPSLVDALPEALENARTAARGADQLAEWFVEHVPQTRLTVAVDDFHLTEAAPPVLAFLEHLFSGSVPLHFLIASRPISGLPISDWLARGYCSHLIGPQLLRLTPEDVVSRSKRGDRRESIQVAQLVQDLDGWPIAVTASLRAHVRPDDLPKHLLGHHELLHDYLAEQIWNRLDKRTRHLVEQLAFLPRISVRAVERLGFDNGLLLLEHAQDFIPWLSGPDDGQYRMHQLLREFVQRQVERQSLSRARELRLSTARILDDEHEAAGDVLQRFVDADARNDVLRILERENFALLDGGYVDVVASALKSLGDHCSTAAALALRAEHEATSGRVDSAKRLYRRAIAHGQPGTLQTEAICRLALLTSSTSVGDAADIIERALQGAGCSELERCQLTSLLATLHSQRGRHDEARRLIEEALDESAAAPESVLCRVCIRAGLVALYAGDLERAERYSLEGARLASQCGALAQVARAYSTVATLFHSLGDLARAESYAAQVLMVGKRGGNRHAQAFALRCLLEIAREQAAYDSFESYVRELRELAYDGPYALRTCSPNLMLAALQRGDAEAALRIAERPEVLLYLAADDQRRFWAARSIAHAFSNDRDGVVRSLAEFDRAWEKESAVWWKRDRAFDERLTLLASIIAGVPSARRRLQRLTATPWFPCLDKALTSLLNQEHERIESATRQLENVGLAGAASLIRVAATVAQQRRTVRGSSTPAKITNAESVVLRALSEGLSNREIADRLGRSQNTVRVQVSSVLRKLEASSRTEAALIARRLSLLG